MVKLAGERVVLDCSSFAHFEDGITDFHGGMGDGAVGLGGAD